MPAWKLEPDPLPSEYVVVAPPLLVPPLLLPLLLPPLLLALDPVKELPPHALSAITAAAEAATNTNLCMSHLQIGNQSVIQPISKR
jgi:hypothetical protein